MCMENALGNQISFLLFKSIFHQYETFFFLAAMRPVSMIIGALVT